MSLSTSPLVYTGDIIGESDVDLYGFRLAGAATVKIQLATPVAPGNATRLGLSVFDGVGVIRLDLPRRVGALSQTQALLSAGSYTIIVGASSGQGTNTSYTVTVELVS